MHYNENLSIADYANFLSFVQSIFKWDTGNNNNLMLHRKISFPVLFIIHWDLKIWF